MTRKNWMSAALMLMAVMMTGTACNNPIWLHIIAPLGDDTNALKGTVKMGFVNETNYRVITYWGAFNPLDLSQNTQVKKLVLEAGAQSQQPENVTCTRQFAIAGEDLRTVVEKAKPEGIDPADINEKINFSNVKDPKAANAEEPTAGTADPVMYFIGVDYACGDFVEVHFKQDPTTKAFFVEIFPSEQE